MWQEKGALVAAALLVCGSSAASAQSNDARSRSDMGSGQNQPGIHRDWIPGALSPAAENRPGNPTRYDRAWPAGPLYPAATDERSDGGERFERSRQADQRSFLRQHLQNAGFRNIRILDTTFLVQASTGDGRTVLMLIDPPSASAGAGRGTSEQAARSKSSSAGPDQANARSQQFGTARSTGPRVNMGEMSDRMANQGLMQPEQIRSHLQARGFSDISDLTRNENVYGGTANWFGERVDVRVDGRNGYLIRPSNLTQRQLRTMLDSQGWTSVEAIDRRDTSYRVRALRNGQPYVLWVDARTGEIDRQVASSDRVPSARQ
jgi:hypothetical protein